MIRLALLILVFGCGRIGFDPVLDSGTDGQPFDARGDANLSDAGRDAETDADDASMDASDGCVPSAELCNALDDDCNGVIDDGCATGIIDLPAPPEPGLTALWGTSQDELWVVGTGGVFHLKSGTWTVVDDSFSGRDVYAIGDDVWVIDSVGQVRRGGLGRSFEVVPSPGVWSAVHGTSSTNIWVGGGAVEVARWDGSDWSSQTEDSAGDTLTHLVVVDADTCWIAASAGVWILEETRWTRLYSGSAGVDSVTSFHATSANNAWLTAADDHGGVGAYQSLAGSNFQFRNADGSDFGSMGTIWARGSDDAVLIHGDTSGSRFMSFSGTEFRAVVDVTLGARDIWGSPDGAFYLLYTDRIARVQR